MMKASQFIATAVVLGLRAAPASCSAAPPETAMRSRFSSKAYEYACRSPYYNQCIVGGQTLTEGYGHIEATPPATSETRGSIEDGIILVPVGRSTANTVGVPISVTAAPAAMAWGSDHNEGGNVMLAEIDGEDTDGSRGEGILSNVVPEPVPSGALDNNDPEQEADHQMGAWQGGEWLDEFGVATGPADWLDEDGIATTPEGWFTAGAAAAAQTQLGGSLFHIEGMPLETILEDVMEDYGQHEGGDGLPVDVLIEDGGGDGLPELPEFHQQGNSDESFSNSGGSNGFWKALTASLGYMTQILRLEVIRTIIYGREAEGGCGTGDGNDRRGGNNSAAPETSVPSRPTLGATIASALRGFGASVRNAWDAVTDAVTDALRSNRGEGKAAPHS